MFRSCRSEQPILKNILTFFKADFSLAKSGFNETKVYHIKIGVSNRHKFMYRGNILGSFTLTSSFLMFVNQIFTMRCMKRLEAKSDTGHKGIRIEYWVLGIGY